MNPSPSSWYHEQDGVARGPFTSDEMRVRFQSGAFRPDTFVWHPALPRWLPIADSQPDWSLDTSANPPPSVPPSSAPQAPPSPRRKSLFSRLFGRWLAPSAPKEGP